MTAQSAANPQRLFQQAVELHRQGQLAQAEALYRQVVAAQPGNAAALHMFGVLYLQQDRNAEALELIGAALKLDPRDADALSNSGNALKGLGRHDEALARFDAAIAQNPHAPGPLYNRALLLQLLKRFEDALAALDQLLALEPRLGEAWYNRASLLLRQMNRPQEALPDFDRALAINPGFALGWSERGAALARLGSDEEALASYDKALVIQPSLAAAVKAKGQLLFKLGRVDQGMDFFRRAADMAYGTAPSPLVAGREAPDFKLRHDREQDAYQKAMRDHAATVAGARLQGPAVNPDNDLAAIDTQWRTGRPQVAVIDNLLTVEALDSLRRFCLEAPMWRAYYPDGYLGAFPEHGFACPLLAQIAEELSRTFPTIFRAHWLRYLWGFKYDSDMHGIAIHADDAAVNVNFWITPDEANLDSESGGLVIWDEAAPLDWDFAKFNHDAGAIRDFLARHQAKSMTVPYRGNRAVIFDSDLFHETDTIRFKPGYLNRRINVTMLYGLREGGDPSPD